MSQTGRTNVGRKSRSVNSRVSSDVTWARLVLVRCLVTGVVTVLTVLIRVKTVTRARSKLRPCVSLSGMVA